MTITFEDAKRENVKARVALWGLNGAGKSLAALKIARALGEPIYGIDTENGRMKLYADQFTFKHGDLPKEQRTPEGMRDAVRVAIAAGAGTVIVDSISHEWLACLADADRFGDWKNVSPRHRDFFDELVAVPAHVIVTMRSHIKYDVSEVVENGRKKQQIVALGPGPVQGKGVEYEFDVLGYIDRETHEITFANRCSALVGQTLDVDEAIPPLLAWLAEGEPDPNMQRAPDEKVAELRGLLLAEGLQEAVVEDSFHRQALRSGGVLTAGWVDEKIAASHDRAAGEQANPAPVENPVDVPKTWAQVKAAIQSAYGESTLPDFEEFVSQASRHMYPDKVVEDAWSAKGSLTRAQWATLLQKAAGATAGLLENVERDFPPPSREEIRVAFALVLDGAALEGPSWSMGPDEPERPARPAVGSGVAADATLEAEANAAEA